MIHNQITSIHHYFEQYIDTEGKEGIEQVFLTINHEERTFSIHPEMPLVGFDSVADPRHRYATIDRLAFEYADIGKNHARHIARHACIQAALFFAIKLLEQPGDDDTWELCRRYGLMAIDIEIP